MMENMEYGRERLKNIVQKEAKEKEVEEQQQEEEVPVAAAAKEQQQDDDEQYDTVAKIKLVYEEKRVREFRVTGNLNKSNTMMIMANITPQIEMWTKEIYSFKSEIHWGGSVVKGYYKTLTLPPGMFTGLDEIQAYMEECEQKRLDLDNEKVWSKAYLPAERTNEARGNYDSKVIFKHIQIRLVASNEPLMGFRPLPDWLRDKRCIYAIDTCGDNLCVWRCLAICKSHVRGEKNQLEKRNSRAALGLVRE